ncbi:MAG: alanine--tRNA ligase [bacterium]
MNASNHIQRTTGRELRESFLRFFEERGHARVKSSPVIPWDDPTLLFTNAGMNQFKDIFLGRRPVPYAPARAASVQKCLRAGGKHNDLENVGFTTRHHTFFEMLGNWSFGDYYKKESVEWAWEYVTKVLGLPEARLHATVFREDDEAHGVWAKQIGLPDARITRLDEADNFWAMGDTGPCGPCSEIHFDQGPAVGCGKATCGPGCDCGRYLEIWNLVFMEFNKTDDGKLAPLPAKNVDTGMGLERVLGLLQGVPSNFDTDLFEPVFDDIEAATGKGRGDQKFMPSFRVIGDHLRALSFAIADGALPSNEGRGYVLRRILRRAVRHARILGIEGPYIWTLVDPLRRVMGEAYPELNEHAAKIQQVIQREEESFGRTIDRGLTHFEKIAKDAGGAGGKKTIPGDAVFLLYDTYGFPPDMTAVMARERGLGFDDDGFQREMDAQRERSRAGGTFKMAAEGEWTEVAGEPERAGEFLRADHPEIAAALAKGSLHVHGARVLRFREAPAAVAAKYAIAHLASSDAASRAPSGAAAQSAPVASLYEVVLDRTPFYAESGGQIGDTGQLVWGSGASAHHIRVVDTVATLVGNAHRVAVDRPGMLAMAAEPLTAQVDLDRRRAIMRNHTATHLLHAALRKTLGTHVTQAGSLVAPDRLRFDFQHFSKVTKEEMAKIETLVNEAVYRDLAVSTDNTTFDGARARGAMALFGEKYGDEVRMVSIASSPVDAAADLGGLSAIAPDNRDAFVSRELCGGTHVARTGEIGPFLVTLESSVAAGVRRVEAVSGEGALRRIHETRALLEEAAALLNTTPSELPTRVTAVLAAGKEKDRAREKAKSAGAGASVDGLLENAARVGDARVIASRVSAADIDELKSLADSMRAKGAGIVGVLAGEWDGKVAFVAVASDDLATRGVHAGKLVGAVAAATGGKGGGNPTFAQAGGKDAAKIDEALGLVEAWVRTALGA